ncbi:MAG: MerR family transcriptional regulator [Promethearchaeia archaeon]
MYSIGIATQLLGVCRKTFRRWDKSNKIRCLRTTGGHRRFPINEIQRFLAWESGKSGAVKNPLVPSASLLQNPSKYAFSKSSVNLLKFI